MSFMSTLNPSDPNQEQAVPEELAIPVAKDQKSIPEASAGDGALPGRPDESAGESPDELPPEAAEALLASEESSFAGNAVRVRAPARAQGEGPGARAWKVR